VTSALTPDPSPARRGEKSPNPPVPSTSALLRTVGWMLLALSCFSVMAVAARELSGALGTFEIVTFRSSIGLAIIALIIAARRRQEWRTQQLSPQIARNLSHFIGQFAWFYALGVIPLASVFALEFTTPIWTTLLAALFFGERVTQGRIVAVVSGFVGVLIVLRPGLVAWPLAAYGMLIGAACYGVAHNLTKTLTAQNSTLTILFYMMLLQLPLGLFPALSHWVWPTPTQYGWLTLIGTLGLFAHFCMTRAIAMSAVSVVIPLDFLRLPLIAAIGFFVYGEPLNMWTVVGAVLMLAGILYNLRKETRD
jgi:drug/metabolite transporter (DMT)-like permease